MASTRGPRSLSPPRFAPPRAARRGAWATEYATLPACPADATGRLRLLSGLEMSRKSLAPKRSPKYKSRFAHLTPTLLARDDGDCSGVFREAGADALKECDRDKCSCFEQDVQPKQAVNCGNCFSASCDWSRSSCVEQLASIATCPLLDATVLKSVRHTQRSESLVYIMGGTARCLGVLNLSNIENHSDKRHCALCPRKVTEIENNSRITR